MTRKLTPHTPKTGKKLSPEALRLARAIPAWRRSPIRPYPRPAQGGPR
jgi:hypothetical protein